MHRGHVNLINRLQMSTPELTKVSSMLDLGMHFPLTFEPERRQLTAPALQKPYFFPRPDTVS